MPVVRRRSAEPPDPKAGLCDCDRFWKVNPRPEGVHLHGCPTQPKRRFIATD